MRAGWRQIWRSATLLLVLALATLAAPPAAAQPSNLEALSRQVAREIVGAMDFTTLMRQSMARGGPAPFGEAAEFRPEWPKLVMEAMEEEVASSGAFEEVVARRLQAGFTYEELTAGLAIVSDPVIKAAIREAAQGGGGPTRMCAGACLRAVQSPPGRRFMEKFGKVASDRALQGDTFAALMPGLLRRLADKIEAAERARTGGGAAQVEK